MTQLKRTYQVLQIPLDAKLTVSDVRFLVELHMTSVILAADMSRANASTLKADWKDMDLLYPTWPRARNFFFDIEQKVIKQQKTVTYPQVAAIISEIISTF